LRRERIAAKPLGSERRLTDVACGDTIAPDPQFARDALRHGLAVSVDAIEPRVPERPADRDRGGGLRQIAVPDFVIGREHRGFGRSISVGDGAYRACREQLPQRFE
jgi:hypothetical protein